MDIAGPAIIKLNDNNYQLWKHQVKLLLKAKKVWHTIIDEKPEGATEIETFEEKSALAASIILSSLEVQQAQQVLNLDESKEIWNKLQQIHEGKIASRKVDLRLELSTIKMKENENVEKYLARGQYLRDQLDQCNCPIENEEYIGLLLNGLPSSYRSIRVQMKSTGLEKLTLEEFRNGLKAQEDEFKIADVETKLEAACVSKGNTKFSNKQNPKANVNCWVCNKRGHYARDCYYRGGRKRATNNKTDREKEEKEEVNTVSANEENHESAMNATSKEEEVNSVKWYLDSGATSHMTYDKSLFTELNPINNKEVKIADGNFIEARGSGTVRVRITNKQCFYKYITVTDVLYVPDIKENLMSISAFEKKGFTVKFKDGSCEIRRNDGVLMMTGKRINNLYLAEVDRPTDKLVQEKVELSAEVWHRRYGHQSVTTLNKMKNEGLVHGLEQGLEFTANNTAKCENCIIGKSTKVTFTGHQEIRTHGVLELIHMDLCGPIQEPSLAGSKYMYILVDDYSRKLFVYFLKSKDETFSKFKVFKAEVENQLNKKIKRIRSDNGSEFINSDFKEFLQEHGIIHERSAPYNPQENGIAERNNRTVIQMVRCMLSDSNLPAKFWAEAAYYAVYLKNRTYMKKVGMTPEERFTEKKPDVKHLKIFGSLAYYLIDKQNRRKLDSVSKEAIFLGFSHLTKHYRLFCKERNTVITVRDAKIIEDKKGSEILKEKVQNHEYIDIKYILDITEGKIQNEVEEEVEPVIENREVIERLEDNLEESEVSNDLGSESEESEPDDGEKNTSNVDPDYLPVGPNFEVEILRRSNRLQNKTNLVVDYINVPRSYEEAILSSNKNEWMKAIQEELMSHSINKTWDIVNRPKNKQTIDSKWVFKVKENSDGTINKFKARLVARGFNQVKGENYDEIFAPVIRLSTLRLIFAIATQCDFDLYQMDVTTAYLNGTLQEEIYMEIPSGLDENKIKKVCKLQKGLYGLKQSARVWYLTIKRELEKLEFKEIESTPCVFIYEKGHIYMIACLYVDDILLATNSKETAIEKVNILNKIFDIKFMGEAKYLLGWEIERHKNEGILHIKQEKYINRVLQRFNMNECKASSVPMQSNNVKETNVIAVSDNVPYQELIGSLIYLSQGTRPDITFATTYLSQFNTKYTKENWVQAKQVLRYLKGTIREGIMYKRSKKKLEIYSDASWNNNLDGKGFSGYICKLAEGAISWQCKKQEVVALSSCESEFMALTETVKELIWIKKVFSELKQEERIENLTIYADNQAAIKLTNNSAYHSRTKHIQRKFFFIRDEVERNKINLTYVESQNNTADFLTKAVTKPILERCKKQVGLRVRGMQ